MVTHSSESSRLSVFMGKLISGVQDHMLDYYGVYNLSFDKLVEFFKRKEEQE